MYIEHLGFFHQSLKPVLHLSCSQMPCLNVFSTLHQAFLSDALFWDSWCRREHAGDCGFQPHDHRRPQAGLAAALPHRWERVNFKSVCTVVAQKYFMTIASDEAFIISQSYSEIFIRVLISKFRLSKIKYNNKTKTRMTLLQHVSYQLCYFSSLAFFLK